MKKINRKRPPSVSVTGSFLSIFSKWSQESFANALKDPTIRGFTRMLNDPEGVQLFINLGQTSQDGYVKMAIDRKIVKHKNAFKELRKSISNKFQQALISGIENGFKRLSVEHQDVYFKIIEKSDLYLLTKQIYLEELIRNPWNIPHTFLSQEMTNHFSDSAGKASIQSKNFRKFRSANTDYVHIIGAAYCGVFTCDGEVSSSIKNYREEWGLNPQLSRQQLGRKFVPHLIKQLGY